MNRTPEENAKLEVDELTELLRTDDSFADLRAALIAHGTRPDDVLLGGLIEGEDESSYGVFVSRDGACTLFETVGRGEVIRWERVEDPNTLGDAFTAIGMAIALATGNE